MEESNFESQLKRKLNERVIQPSPNAWQRVEKRNKKKKRQMKPFYWMAAACVIGLCVLLLQPTSSETHKQVVEIPQQNAKPPTMKSAVVEMVPQTPEPSNHIIYATAEVDSPTISVSPTTHKETDIAIKLPAVTHAESQKISEIVANVEKLHKSGTDVTEKMLDSMINYGRMQIAAEKLAKQPKTDAFTLLNEAEKDLDRSFKDRVFDALHKKIKIAFSNR